MAKKTKQTTASIEDKLKALHQLQVIDTEVDKIRIVRGELPLEIEDLGKFPPVIISEKLSDTSSNASERFDDSTSIPISAVCSKFFLNTFQESLLIKW